MNIYLDTMQDSLSYIILILIGVVIYLLVAQRKKNEEPKDNTQELNSLKESINNSFNSMSASFNNLSKDVTRDMTQTLTSVNEKIQSCNFRTQYSFSLLTIFTYGFSNIKSSKACN